MSKELLRGKGQKGDMLSRREAIEQGRAELNSLYAQIPEGSYDLSLRDLVEQQNRRVSSSGELPVEESKKIEDNAASPPVSLNSSNKPFFSMPSPQRMPASRPAIRTQVSPRKVSPRITPPSSPARRSIQGYPLKEQVRPIFPVLNFDNVSNKCSACSAHVIFFKNRCHVCNRVYCSKCIKHPMCGSKCIQAGLTSPPPTKRSVPSCWSFMGTSKQSPSKVSH